VSRFDTPAGEVIPAAKQWPGASRCRRCGRRRTPRIAGPRSVVRRRRLLPTERSCLVGVWTAGRCSRNRRKPRSGPSVSSDVPGGHSVGTRRLSQAKPPWPSQLSRCIPTCARMAGVPAAPCRGRWNLVTCQVPLVRFRQYCQGRTPHFEQAVPAHASHARRSAASTVAASTLTPVGLASRVKYSDTRR